MSSQAEPRPAVHSSSADTFEPQKPRTREECRALPVRDDVRACMEEIIAIGKSEIEQIRGETEALRAENERLDAEIEKRLDAFEASVLEDVEAKDPD